MLHRPADSRLLANLLSHEKEHAKALAAQIESAQASLSSFSAYASASPPPASHAIVAVAGTLVGANDALRTYLFAVEEWCDQLRELKELEDEVGNVVRDREILVDRLIKASKTTQKRRSGVSNSGSPGSSMFASSSNVGLEHLAFSNSKLNLAQNELQACEAHLSERERALAQMRENVVIRGLKGRCRAMVECGWKWGEMGKEGTRALESLNINVYTTPTNNSFLKPLPDPHATYSRPSSDMSSIAPSQSASQIAAMNDGAASPFTSPGSSQAHGSGMVSTNGRPLSDAGIRDYLLQIPPAHSISDQLLPPTKAIAEEDENGGGSSEDESEADGGPLEVHENKPFAIANGVVVQDSSSSTPNRKTREKESKRWNDTFPSSVSAPVTVTTHPQLDIFGNSRESPSRERKNSTIFGSFMGLFHKRGRTASFSSLPSSVKASPPKSRKASPWMTRTDKNLKKSNIADDSSDEDTERTPPAKTSINYEALRQKSATEAKALPKPSTQQSSPERKPKGGKKLRKQSENQRRNTVDYSGSKTTLSNFDTPVPVPALKKTAAEDTVISNGTNETTPVASVPVSRSSTVKSVSSNTSGRRAASLDEGPSRTASRRSGTRSDIGQGNATRAAASPAPSSRSNTNRNFSAPIGANGMSLMSIIEDVTAANRRGWSQANPSNTLFEVKAPPTSVLVDDLRADSSQDTPSPASRAQHVRQESDPSARVHRMGSMSASSSEPHLPLSRNSRSTTQQASKPPVPLRSALRNGSPSPLKLSAPVTALRSASPSKSKAQSSPSAAIPRSRDLSMPSDSRRESYASDTSMSSYETGREDFEDEEEQLMIDVNPQTASESESTPQQAAFELPPLVNGQSNGIHLPNSNRHDTEGRQASESASSDSTTGPSRRKSVRMAPLPTFSPTPPAIYDDEMDHSPWTAELGPSSWQTRTKAGDVWEDSDASDEEYSRAKRMLLRVAQKTEKKRRPSY